MNRYFICTCLSAFLLVISGCMSGDTVHESEIKKAVVKYNNALIEAHKNVNIEPMKAAAGEDAVSRTEKFIAAYLASGQFMESELLNLKFIEIKITADRAEARTSEDWTFKWLNYKTKAEVEPLRKIHYEMLYHIVQKDNRWIVEKAEVMKG